MDNEFELMILDAINVNTSDIHITYYSDRLTEYKFRIKGKLKTVKQTDQESGKKLLNYIRYKSNIDLNYITKPQTGSMVFKTRNKNYYLRVSSLPGMQSDSMVIRILNNCNTLTLQQLTVFEDTKHFLKSIIEKDSGLLIISGPTGSGKSTTLYTLLDEIYNSSNRNIVTLEDPVEIKKEYCLQIQINHRKGIEYNDTLKQILRHDPDVIMIGEIRDEDSAAIAVRCALTGHLVLTTIHSGNAENTLKRLLNLGVSKIDIEDILIGIMNQKMLYTDKQLIVLNEFIDQINLQKFINNQPFQYITYKERIQDLLSRKLIQEKDIRGI